MPTVKSRADADFLAHLQRCADTVAGWPQWKRELGMRVLGRCPSHEDDDMRWYWVVVTEALDGPWLAGAWVRAACRVDAWHTVRREVSALHRFTFWDATAEIDLSPRDLTFAGRPPAAGDRSELFDFVVPCCIVDCREK